MVEADTPETDYYAEEQKTFIDEPAILDKFKAAAVITDGKLFSCQLLRQLIIFLCFSVPGEGKRALCAWRRHCHHLQHDRCYDWRRGQEDLREQEEQTFRTRYCFPNLHLSKQRYGSLLSSYGRKHTALGWRSRQNVSLSFLSETCLMLAIRRSLVLSNHKFQLLWCKCCSKLQSKTFIMAMMGH